MTDLTGATSPHMLAKLWTMTKITGSESPTEAVVKATMQLCGEELDKVLALLPQPTGEPVAWVSPGQLAAHSDPIDGDTQDDGPLPARYLPVRKTKAGLFTQPLYATSPDVETLTRQRDGYQKHLRACEQIAGRALGYPWFMDDQDNFPGATEVNGVCIGEHVGDTIVEELANRLKATEAEREAALARAEGAEGALKGERTEVLPREEALLEALALIREGYRVDHTSKFAQGIAAGALEVHGRWFLSEADLLGGSMQIDRRLPRPCYTMSEPHLSGWRVVLGYETLKDAQDAQTALSPAPDTVKGSEQ